MKAVFLFSLLVAAVVAAGNGNSNDRNNRNLIERDAKRQKFVIDLLHHLQQDIHHPDFLQYSNSIRLDNKKDYKDLNKVYHMVSLFQNGWFEERNKPFSLFRERNIVTTKALFDFFDTMNDWNTVAMNLIWARRNVNEYQFWHLMTLLVTNNRHFGNLLLPAYYEVFPNQFFTADVMDQAINLRLTLDSDNNNKVVIMSNYTTGVLGSNDNDDNHNVYDLNDIKNNNIKDWNTLKKVMNDIKNQLYNNNGKNKDMKNKIFNNNRNLNQGNTFDNNGEDRMVYFTEDIGLNNYYYFSRMSNSRIVNSKQMYKNINNKDNFNKINGENVNTYENKDKINRRGERYLYQMNQLLARYNLERKSNVLDNVQTVSLEGVIDNGVYPNLRYTNGIQMPNRQNEFNLKKQQNMKLIQVTKDFENRFYRAIDQGFVLNEDGHKVNLENKDGLNILGNLLQENRDSVNTQFYRSLECYYRLLFGGSNNDNVDFTDNRFVPTVLDHYETSMRDSVFWQIMKRVTNIADNFKNKLTGYKTRDVNFNGVQINKVKVDKLATTFNYFDTEITNGITTNFNNNNNDNNDNNDNDNNDSNDSNDSNIDVNDSEIVNSMENINDLFINRNNGDNNQNNGKNLYRKYNKNNKNKRNINNNRNNGDNNDSNNSDESNSNEMNNNGDRDNNKNQVNNNGKRNNYRNANRQGKNNNQKDQGVSLQVNYYHRNAENNMNMKQTIVGRTRRMDTKQFTVTIDVQSNKNQNGIVRIFLGTRINNMQQLNDNRNEFVELDQFIVQLSKGQNVIKRNSYDFKNVVGDPQSMNSIYFRALNFLNKKTTGNDMNTLNYDTNNNNHGFPHRLLLPKGSVGGQEYTLFVIVNDLENDSNNVQFNDNMDTRGTNDNVDSNESDNTNDSNGSNDLNDPNDSKDSNESNEMNQNNNNGNKDMKKRNVNNNDVNNFRWGNTLNNKNTGDNGQGIENGNWGTANGVKIHNYNKGNMNVGNGNGILDNRAMGFPLDRQIFDVTEFKTNNMYFKDVKVYHVDNNQNNFNNYN